MATDQNPKYSLGQLIRELVGSQSAYEANLQEAERINQRSGPFAAQHAFIQAEVLRWQPDKSRMPGIGQIEVLCDARFGNGITAENVKRLRAELCQNHGIDIEGANNLSLHESVHLLSDREKTNLLPPPDALDALHQQFLALCQEPDSQKRGFAFENFLKDFFGAHGLDPHGSFRNLGEQIDGSFELMVNTFLVEARWRKEPANAADLLVLRGKAEKSEWTRGLFISISGFTDLASPSLQIGRKANLIAMSGDDLLSILERKWSLLDALRAKLRHTGETAEVYKPLSELPNNRSESE